MNTGLLKVLGQYAGLAGFCVGLILIIFQTLLKKNIFPKLPGPEAFRLLRLLIAFTFSIGVIGICAWVAIDVVHTLSVKNRTITGHVTNKQTRGSVEGAQIYLGGVNGSTTYSESKTGNFAVPETAPIPDKGAYVYVSQTGFEPFQSSSTVKAGEYVDVELIPSPTVAQKEHTAQSPRQHSALESNDYPRPRIGQASVAGQMENPPPSTAAVTNAATPQISQPIAEQNRLQAPPPAAPPVVQTALLTINTDRLNDWFQIGKDGNDGFWPRNIRLTIDNENIELGFLGASPTIPELRIDKHIQLQKGTHTFAFRVEVDEKVAKRFGLGSFHTSLFPECHRQFFVNEDMNVTPFITLRGSNILQCRLLAESDAIPDRAN